MSALVHESRPDAVLHLAVESHVDRSIDGLQSLLRPTSKARLFWRRWRLLTGSGFRGRQVSRFRFHHDSTDEVFGSLGAAGKFTEATRYEPNSPCSASKAPRLI